MSEFKPSQFIPFGKVDEEYDKLHEELSEIQSNQWQCQPHHGVYCQYVDALRAENERLKEYDDELKYDYNEAMKENVSLHIMLEDTQSELAAVRADAEKVSKGLLRYCTYTYLTINEAKELDRACEVARKYITQGA